MRPVGAAMRQTFESACPTRDVSRHRWFSFSALSPCVRSLDLPAAKAETSDVHQPRLAFFDETLKIQRSARLGFSLENETVDARFLSDLI